MVKIVFAYAALLILMGFAFFGFVQWRDGAEAKGLTALIPAYLGAVVLLAACIAVVPKWRMHAMHGAVLLGLLGVLAGGMGVVGVTKWISGSEVRPLAIMQQLAMGAVSLGFVVLSVKSFIAARRARKAAEAVLGKPKSV
jgi:predicted membrane channel-forming protein YqfA (hemolysin III family)